MLDLILYLKDFLLNLYLFFYTLKYFFILISYAIRQDFLIKLIFIVINKLIVLYFQNLKIVSLKNKTCLLKISRVSKILLHFYFYWICYLDYLLF
jgi:hypothetical protein